MTYRHLKNLRDRGHGFTLIELVVVLAIIGILIAAAVPMYLGARQKAYKAEASNALQEIKTMEWAYFMRYGTFVNGTFISIGFTAPNSKNWSYSRGSATARSVIVSAAGKVGSPIHGKRMTLTLNSNGSATTSASF